MKKSQFAVALILSGVLAGQAGVAVAQTFSERATCKLTNTQANKTLYEGGCKVTQSMSGKNTIFSVKMGSGEPFMFAGVRGEKLDARPRRNPVHRSPQWRDFPLVGLRARGC